MKIIEETLLQQTLMEAIKTCHPDRIFILTDINTSQLCLPLVEPLFKEADLTFYPIVIQAGDDNKTLSQVSHIWQTLQEQDATRHSLMINLGGGMVTDLGGFAASCFKRGIRFINIPTTLLSMVDASLGGKTGINFGMFKNEIGVFSDATEVIICPAFLKTLDEDNLLSGYAEMLKHELISANLHSVDSINSLFTVHCSLLTELTQSIEVKRRIVAEDPHEQGIRKALNFGHTIGHAIETWNMKRGTPILHGFAVAWGLVAELYLSVAKCGYPTLQLRQVSRLVRDSYGTCHITCNDYPELLQLMLHDKKNTSGKGINFTLLGSSQEILINQTATEEEIRESLDFLREG